MQQDTKVQSIFNRVIAAGHYSDTEREGTYPYMCVSLDAAVRHGHITIAECVQAQLAIVEYLEAVDYADTLAGALISSDLPSDFEDCLAIYRDWANRPRLGVRTVGAEHA